MPDAQLHLRGEDLLLLPERGVYWPAKQTLIVADLHWAKSEALQKIGIPLPSTALADDLVRLRHVALRLGAQRILILGDLVHAASALTAAVAAQISVWRHSVAALSIDLIRGNHDRGLRLPLDWRIQELADAYQEGPFCFTHAGDDSPHRAPGAPLVWAGHIHPAVTLRGGRDKLRLRCFALDPHALWLPAFGSLTGSYDIQKTATRRIFVIADTTVCEIAGGLARPTQ